MKKCFLVIATLLLLVSGTLAFNSPKASASTKYPGKKIYVKAGDILVTSKKTTSYYTGHAAIVTDDLHVVEIAGPGKHPAIWTASSWLKNYKIKNVVRLDNSSAAKKAGKWAKTYQKSHKTATYGIWTNLDTFSKEYCSKLVWQAYKYGAHYDLTQFFYGRMQTWTPTSAYMKIRPYDFLDGIHKYGDRVY